MKSYCTSATLIVLLIASVAAIKVQPLVVTETRVNPIVADPHGFGGDRSDMSIKLHVSGPEMKGATQYGKIEISEAVDDAGTDLVPKKDEHKFLGSSDGFQKISRFFDWEKKETDGFDFKIDLGLPARKATTIKSVKGQFVVLAGGKDEVATLTKLASTIGKAADDAVLKGAGITVTPIKSEDKSELALEFAGARRERIPETLQVNRSYFEGRARG